MQLNVLRASNISPFRGFLIAEYGWRVRLSIISALLVCFSSAVAQVSNPYHLNGNAYQENCNCYTLTPNATFQSGSVWNINKIDLREPFDFKFNINLGSNNESGADGIAFVLQPISTSIGSAGGGMGYEGVSPSIGVIVDTWQNYEDNDPSADHIAIHKNGIIDHSPANDVAGPTSAMISSANIEDGQWHTLRITWDADTKELSTQIDGDNRVKATIDMTAVIFNNDPMVYWGFTSATGGGTNHQRVCTSLNPGFYFPPDQKTCFPTPIQFIDSSTSFGTIEKWFWDFGNGVMSNDATPDPVVYASPGIYEAKLSILGNNGCVSDTFSRTVVVGSAPIAAFVYEPSQVCIGTPVNFVDSSSVEFGTINKWEWTVGSDSYASQTPPPLLLNGTNEVTLRVETQEGCVSDLAGTTLTAEPSPVVDFQTADVCFDKPALFSGANNEPAIRIRQWYWNFGDGNSRMNLDGQQAYRYRHGGTYNVQLVAIAENGCPSAPVIKTLNVYESRAFAGNDTIAAPNQPVTLNGSGGEFYKWSPADGLSADDIPNPVAILNSDAQYVLTAFTTAGCFTTDTVSIKVYKGPSFYVPSAFSPNGDGKNDLFRFVAVGMSSIDQFQVFNRFGQMIYSSTSIGSGWDGRLNGIDQAVGTYVWMIRGVDYTGVSHFRRGTVTLVR